jgi:hypothetical protein
MWRSNHLAKSTLTPSESFWEQSKQAPSDEAACKQGCQHYLTCMNSLKSSGGSVKK